MTAILFVLLVCCSSTSVAFDDSSENVAINTGETATFICDLPERFSNKQADFYGPTGRLLAGRSGDALSSDDRRRFQLEHTYAWTWSLLISDASEDDAGEYTCRVSSDDRTLTIIKRFNFTVLTPPKIVDITIESNNHGVLIENEQVILKCIVRGIPPPRILWHLPGKKNALAINHRDDRNLLTFENKLLIRNFSRTTPMNYQCIADNGIPPRDTRTRYLVPAIAPELTIQSSLSRGSSQLLLTCLIVARPLTYAKWKHNRLEMTNIKRVEINDYTIHLIALLPIDSLNTSGTFGMYECVAENQLKVSKAFIMIDDAILASPVTASVAKQQRMSSSSSSPSYAQIELLLNCSASLSWHLSLLISSTVQLLFWINPMDLLPKR